MSSAATVNETQIDTCEPSEAMADLASYPGARGQEISAWYLLLAHALNIHLFYCKIFRLRHENVVAVIQATPRPHLSY